MGLFFRLFAKPTVEENLFAALIKSIEDECDLLDEIGVDIVKHRALTDVNRNKVHYLADGIPDGIVQKHALFTVANSAHYELISGMHHIYRGVLSIEGEGLLSIWRVTAKKLLSLKYTTEDEIESTRKNLMNDIKYVG